MQSQEFQEALDALVASSQKETVAIMCAEAVPWRCHRNLVADALVARGVEVVQALAPGDARPHQLTPFAKLRGAQVTYPAEEPLL